MKVSEYEHLLSRFEAIIERVERLLPTAPSPTDWAYDAYRWRHAANGGWIEPIPHPHQVQLGDLLCMDRQKAELLRNTRQFIRGKPANNALLWGSRGTGKSTLVKAVFNSFTAHGLRLIEVEPAHLVQLPEIAARLRERNDRFIIYCDDLSFESNNFGYKSLKAVLEGTAAAPPENVLVYATSNRRHLLPEYQSENQAAHVVDGELHQGEAVEEKISLSERFGLWLSFYPFTQDQYLEICDHWLRKLGAADTRDDTLRKAALQWALHRGSRSGRVARQFALDHAGRD